MDCPLSGFYNPVYQPHESTQAVPGPTWDELTGLLCNFAAHLFHVQCCTLSPAQLVTEKAFELSSFQIINSLDHDGK